MRLGEPDRGQRELFMLNDQVIEELSLVARGGSCHTGAFVHAHDVLHMACHGSASEIMWQLHPRRSSSVFMFMEFTEL